MYCLIEKFLCTHVGTHMSVQILTYAVTRIFQRKTDSSEETLLQPTGNSILQKCVILIQSYVFNEMIRLFPVKVPVKNYNDVDWFKQAKNTELTCNCLTCLWFSSALLILSKRSHCKRKTHWVSDCTTVCVCVCVCVGMSHWHGLPRQQSSCSQYVFCNKR